MRARWLGVHPLARAGGLALLLIVAFVVLFASGPVSAGRIRGWMGGASGVRAAVVFVAIYVGLTVACAPGPVVAGLSGLLFGVVEGTLLAVVGGLVGAVVAFTISRSVAGDLVGRVGGVRIRRIAGWIGQRGFRSVVYARIMPGSPYGIVSYAAGLAPVRPGAFALATVIVATPRAFSYAALGGSVNHLTSPVALVADGVIAGMILLGFGLGIREYVQARRARVVVRS